MFNGVCLANAEPDEKMPSLKVTCMAAMRLLEMSSTWCSFSKTLHYIVLP